MTGEPPAPRRQARSSTGATIPAADLLQVDGATIAYADTGAPPGDPDAQTVVFGHGLFFDRWMFRPQIETLKHRYDIDT
jgi:pimeloyl-ACP methyl ester carboxylesterase